MNRSRRFGRFAGPPGQAEASAADREGSAAARCGALSWIATFASVVLLAAGSSPGLAQSGKPIALGSQLPRPDRSLDAATGSSVTLSGLQRENGLVVIFWGNTCPWVHRWEDRVVEIAREHAARGFGFVAVNSNDPVAYPGDDLEAMRERAADYPFPYVLDRGAELAAAFGASRTPQVFVFGPDGRLAYTGAVDDAPREDSGVERPYLRTALSALGEGEEVPSPVTRAFGCTIKRP